MKKEEMESFAKGHWAYLIALVLLIVCLGIGIAILNGISSLSEKIKDSDAEAHVVVSEEKQSGSDNSLQVDNAHSSFLLAEDEGNSIIFRDTCYLNAISRDTGNSSYFESYVSFLNQNNMEYSYYYNLYSLLISKAYEADSTDLATIDSEISFLQEKLETMITEADAKATSLWDENYQDFIALANAESFDMDIFNNYTDILTSLYSLITDPSSETQEEYEYVVYITTLADTYSKADNVATFIINNFSEDVFESFYSTYSQIYSEALSTFATRDESNDGEFSNMLTTCEDELISKNKQILSLYEKTLIAKAKNLYSSCKGNLNTRYGVLSKLSTVISTLSEFATSGEASNVIKSYYSLKDQISKEMFSEYQKWASKILQNIDATINKTDKKEKLRYLFTNGFFNIDSDLLIPQLKTWYESYDTEKMKEDSTYDYNTLITRYPIKQYTLEDMID